MGGFLKTIGKLGVTGAATAAGGPLAGAAASAGMGALGSVMGGGNFYDMLGSGLASGANQFIMGPAGSTMGEAPSLLDVLNKSNVNPLVSTGALDEFERLRL